MWVRDKEPSLEVRSKIDEWLLGVGAPTLMQSDLLSCWGDTDDNGN